VLYLAFHLPSLAESMASHAGALAAAVGDGKVSAAALNGLSVLVLAVPLVGLAIMSVRAVQRWSDPAVTRRMAKAILTFGAPR